MSCDPNQQPSGHGHPDPLSRGAELVVDHDYKYPADATSRLIFDLDSSRCVNCKGGEIVALETGDHHVTAICRECGRTQEIDVDE